MTEILQFHTFDTNVRLAPSRFASSSSQQEAVQTLQRLCATASQGAQALDPLGRLRVPPGRSRVDASALPFGGLILAHAQERSSATRFQLTHNWLVSRKRVFLPLINLDR